MVSSEKLCRSFVLALAEVPNATQQEAQALLTPENLAAMTSLTGVWLASQGVPVVGEAVDAALVGLGIVLMAAQAADLSNALWRYVNLTATARNQEELKAASAHLARAIALVGVNIVTFILTKKVSASTRRPPRLEKPTLQTATHPGTSPARASSWTGGPGGHPDAHASRQNGSSSPAPIAEGPTVSSTPNAFAVNAIVKRIRPAAFKRWLDETPRRHVTGDDVAKKFQRVHAGEEELLVKGGNEQVWADGASLGDAHLVEIKHIKDPDTSPFIDGSKCGDAVRGMIRDQVYKEFKRYAAVINDPATPAVGLEVIINDAQAIPFFQALMHQLGIPGRIRVAASGATP